MILPAEQPLLAGRWEPFVDTFVIEALDLTGATLVMQVRKHWDAAGAPLVDLAPAASNAQGLSFTVDTSGVLPISTIQVRINETTVEALPFSVPARGGNAELVYDLQVTLPGVHEKRRYFRGPFIVVPGGTQ